MQVLSQNTDLFRRANLMAHVDLAGRVVPHAHHAEVRADTARGEQAGRVFNLRKQRVCDFFAVEQLWLGRRRGLAKRREIGFEMGYKSAHISSFIGWYNSRVTRVARTIAARWVVSTGSFDGVKATSGGHSFRDLFDGYVTSSRRYYAGISILFTSNEFQVRTTLGTRIKINTRPLLGGLAARSGPAGKSEKRRARHERGRPRRR